MAPIPSPVSDRFRSVEAFVAAYLVAVFGLTAVIVGAWLPIEWTVPTLAIVSGALLVPFWPAFRRASPGGK
jgi:membrane protein implicated in regulation of membrane protease activity